MTIQSPLWWRKWRARRWLECFEIATAEAAIDTGYFEEANALLITAKSEARRKFRIPEGVEL